MEIAGRFEGFTTDYKGIHHITFTAEYKPEPETLQNLVDSGRLRITAVQYREKRSLDANAYFHVLSDKLRKALGMSFASCKNYLLTHEGGQIEYLDGEPVYIETPIPPEKMRENEFLHCQYDSLDVRGDKVIYRYIIYRGSHTFNTAEMSRLIDVTIQECKQQGIETLPPDKIEEMMRIWERNHNPQS